jgi:hypothetical protein
MTQTAVWAHLSGERSMAKAVAAVTMNTAIAAMSRRRWLPRPAGRRVTPTRTWVTG